MSRASIVLSFTPSGLHVNLVFFLCHLACVSFVEFNLNASGVLNTYVVILKKHSTQRLHI